MAKQPRYNPLEPSAFFADGQSARPLLTGTVARGHLRTDAPFYTGRRSQGKGSGPDRPKQEKTPSSREIDLDPTAFVDTFPFPVTREVLQRGQQRYEIFCVVCHDPLGTGSGKIVERGFSPPPSFHTDRSRRLNLLLRKAPVGYYFETITHGFGAMPDYASQVPPRDRWAIIAYIRALQRSQNATLADVPQEQRWQLQKGGQEP